MTENADFGRSLAMAVLEAGGNLAHVAQTRSVERSTVAAAARRHGWPDLAVMRQTLGREDLRTRAVRLGISPDLINPYVQAGEALLAAVKAADADRERQEARERELEEKRAAIEQMRARLAKAEAELASVETTSPAPEPAPAPPTAKDIRIWAAMNGIECPAKGKIPGRVRDAFNEA